MVFMSIENEENLTSNNLEDLIKQKISAYIGVPIDPVSFTQIEKYFSGDSLLVDNFPLKEIQSLTIGDLELNNNDYTIDSDAGLIYFKNDYTGFLILNYTCGLSDAQIELYITPLVQEMLDYESDVGWTKNASSIKEGDVQINLDTSISKGALIQKSLDNLKYMFNTYARMI